MIRTRRIAICALALATLIAPLAQAAVAPEVATLLGQGRASLDERKFDQAIAAYTEAVARAPSDAEVLLRRGNAYLSDGKYREAIADFDEAIRRDPNNAEAYLRRGNAFFVLASNAWDYYDRALADYDAAIRLKPDDAVGYYNRAVAGARAAQHVRRRSLSEMQATVDKSLADYDTAIRLAPEFALAYSSRGRLHAASGRRDSHQRAREDRDEARRLIADREKNDRWLSAGVLLRNQWGRLVSGPKDWDTAHLMVWGRGGVQRGPRLMLSAR